MIACMPRIVFWYRSRIYIVWMLHVCTNQIYDLQPNQACFILCKFQPWLSTFWDQEAVIPPALLDMHRLRMPTAVLQELWLQWQLARTKPYVQEWRREVGNTSLLVALSLHRRWQLQTDGVRIGAREQVETTMETIWWSANSLLQVCMFVPNSGFVLESYLYHMDVFMLGVSV